MYVLELGGTRAESGSWQGSGGRCRKSWYVLAGSVCGGCWGPDCLLGAVGRTMQSRERAWGHFGGEVLCYTEEEMGARLSPQTVEKVASGHKEKMDLAEEM